MRDPSPAESLASCLYRGVVTHHRRRPVQHRFDFPMYLMYVDLAELPRLSRRPLFATGALAPARFRDRDHLGGGGDLAERVRDLVEERSGRRPGGAVRLLTQPRCLGFSFDPVSFYYCFAAGDERVDAVVAEVSNTPWKERHWYVLSAGEAGELRFDVAKEFHVSPFMQMAQRYRFRFAPPGEVLSLGIASREREQGGLFAASLRMERLPWTAGSWARVLARHPAQTWHVFASIYWHARRLKALGVPWVPHPGEAHVPPPDAAEVRT